MTTTLDFKKECRALYAPTTSPAIIDVPKMTFVMADGKGNPNTSAEYSNAVGALYGISYAVKMSKKSGDFPDGYFDFVVPPLEGLWSVEGDEGAPPFIDKDKFIWTLMLRVPDFVTDDVFAHFKGKAAAKKPELDLSVVRLETFTEGLCGQIMHIGSYDDEPSTVADLERFIAKSGYRTEMSGLRQHHEIYLGDPRKVAPEKLKTIIRHPVVKREPDWAGECDMRIEAADWLADVTSKVKRGNKVLFAKDCALFAELNDAIACENHKIMVLWAFEAASTTVDVLRERYPNELRPQIALDTSRAWASGEVKMRKAKRAILDCHALAKEISSPEDIALCHAVGQACSVVHAKGHAIGFPVYELTALVHGLGIDNCKDAVESRVDHYIERIIYWHEHYDDYYGEWADFMEAEE
ncbi:MAG: GyrI-like domain-containing protein [Propionibacteriaceae bacterium]|jgi:hypothetical protein|nr:GyrI-like domain-containing protein [Propionibacteriaceae bacterium]